MGLIGSDVGDFLANVPVLGPVLSATGIVPNPMAKQVGAGFNDVQRKYEQYRPEMWRNRMAALDNAMALFQPAQAQHAGLYGTPETMPMGSMDDMFPLPNHPSGGGPLQITRSSIPSEPTQSEGGGGAVADAAFPGASGRPRTRVSAKWNR